MVMAYLQRHCGRAATSAVWHRLTPANLIRSPRLNSVIFTCGTAALSLIMIRLPSLFQNPNSLLKGRRVAVSGSNDHSMPEEVRERVLAAAYDELTRWGIDRFHILSLADRHGLDPAAIRREWDNEERLMLEVFLAWPGKGVTAPDTGSTGTDLYALAAGMAYYLNTEIGRRLQVTHIIDNPDLPSARIRREVWRARAGTLRIVVDRARQRGELRDGIDPLTVLELLFAPINMRALFTGEPVDDDYCRTISELVLRAITL
jgi:Tetracyclin repressor-like, C-terminal domain